MPSLPNFPVPSTVVVSSGQASSGAIVLSGDTLRVLTGGTATDATIVSGGRLLLAGGVGAADTLDAGAIEIISAGGLGVGELLDGGTQTILAGGTARDDRIAAGGTVQDGGTVLFTEAAGSAVVLGGRLTGSGIVENQGAGTLVLSANVQDFSQADPALTGTIVVAGGGTVELTSGQAAGGPGAGAQPVISFAGQGGVLRIDGAVMTTDPLRGFSAGDAIELAAVADDPDASVSTDGDFVTVSAGGAAFTLDIPGAADFPFVLSEAPGGGTALTIGGTAALAAGAACFAAGTLIDTDRGERPVDTLQIGELVRTARGELRPILWIGHRSYAARFAAGNRDVLPVRIAAGALADGVPRRDLLLSPTHALLIGDALVPAIALADGHAIRQVPIAGSITYFHIELDSHDVVLAEGAPAETFLDDGSRFLFANAALHPDRPGSALPCAPRVEDGHALEAIRRRLADRVASMLQKSADAI